MEHMTEKTLFTHHSSFDEVGGLKPVYAFFALINRAENGAKALKVMVDGEHIWVEDFEFITNLDEFVALQDNAVYDTFIKSLRKNLRGNKSFNADFVRYLLREASNR
ncbi:MAG: hypothetical protein ACRC3J_06820 [Culicoidibacterales bacterium]